MISRKLEPKLRELAGYYPNHVIYGVMASFSRFSVMSTAYQRGLPKGGHQTGLETHRNKAQCR